MPTVAVTDATFQRDVLESELPVLVDFWADWCAPCKQIAPTLEKLANELAGRLTIAKIDVDRNPMVAKALRIQSIPTLVVFRDGRPVDAVQGALPEARLRKLVEPYLAAPQPGGTSIDVKTLAAVLQAGQPVTIVDIREPGDFQRSHLRRAKNIPPASLGAELPKLGKRGPVVLVCRTGEKSKALAEELADGPVHVMALEKGLLEWQGDGHPTYSNREEAALDAASS